MHRYILSPAVIVSAALAQHSSGQPTQSKTAGQAFKNITQLKGTPTDQLLPAMQFMAASLGVECNFCHVTGKMELDDKPAKKTAREMMAMTAAINQNSFKGQRQVTCYSCHHGSSHPVNTPSVEGSDAPARNVPPSASSATADEIVAKYITALGGADSIKKITSRVMKARFTQSELNLPSKSSPRLRTNASPSRTHAQWRERHRIRWNLGLAGQYGPPGSRNDGSGVASRRA